MIVLTEFMEFLTPWSSWYKGRKKSLLKGKATTHLAVQAAAAAALCVTDRAAYSL